MKSGKNKHDRELFREAMADVKPLRPADRVEYTPPRPPARALQQELDDREVLRELLSPADAEEHETG